MPTFDPQKFTGDAVKKCESNCRHGERADARQIVEEVVVIGRMEDHKFKVKYVISNPL